MPAEFSYALLEPFLDSLVPDRHPELVKMEQYAKAHDFPIVGPASGYFCYILTRLLGARTVFELGSGYGYSTAWFARAVDENGGGNVYHTVWDDKLSNMARAHLAALGYPAAEEKPDAKTKIVYAATEAVGEIKKHSGPFDVVFNDIDKQAYASSLDVIATKLRPGGLLIVDNAIWSGKSLDDKDQTENSVAIREFIAKVKASPDWDGMIVPIRDGLMVARRA